MILVHRLDGTPFYLNATLVETVEATPDTVIVLVNGHRYVVQEKAQEVVARILAYSRGMHSPLPRDGESPTGQ